MNHTEFKSIQTSRPPDFTLQFEEGYEPGKSLRCWRLQRFSVADQTDYLLVLVDESLDRKKYGLADSETHLLILAPRYQGDSLFGARDCPLYVNVLFPVISESSVEEVLSGGWIHADDTYFIAFGKIWLANGDDHAQLGRIRPLPERIP
jgi:hypothetical protein